MVADYLEAAHSGSVPSITATQRLDFANAANTCALSVYVNDREWWNHYRAERLGSDGRKLIDSMIVAAQQSVARRDADQRAATGPTPPRRPTRRVQRRGWARTAWMAGALALPAGALLALLPHAHRSVMYTTPSRRQVVVRFDCGAIGTNYRLEPSYIKSQVDDAVYVAFGSSEPPYVSGSADRSIIDACRDAKAEAEPMAFARFVAAFVPLVALAAVAHSRAYLPRRNARVAR